MLSAGRRKVKRRERLQWGLLLMTMVFLVTAVLSGFTESSELDNATRFRRQARINVTTGKNSSDAELSIPSDPEADSESNPIYPHDVIDLATRRKGAAVLHAVGMLYMFVALAVVCDEFFVPALEVIIHRLDISDDVAGATFMAAGGSAPELATSIIGLFLAKSNVGVGTIVGSAVFNILFVIGMCSLFSREILKLTWWPLFRDCLFYIISLAALIAAFSNSQIEYYESIILLLIYLLYVTFMKFNVPIETWVKSKLPSQASRSENEIPRSVKAIVEAISAPNRSQGEKKSTFSYGIVQLMMHSLDPTTDENTAERSSRLYAIGRMKLVCPRVALDLAKTDQGSVTSPDSRTDCEEKTVTGKSTTILYDNEGTKCVTHPDGDAADLAPPPGTSHNGNAPPKDGCNEEKNHSAFVVQSQHNSLHDDGNQNNGTTDITHPSAIEEKTGNGAAPKDPELASSKLDLPEQHNETLDLSWPKTVPKRILYVLLAPIMFLLWITLPDVRDPKKENRFVVTFFLSIVWIAIFSYFMVWMAHQIGETIGLSEAIMGLTFLAAGTSVPDLITSVIVARKGLGDMAVSSSVGSNIFDVTVGLPFPWLLGSIIKLGSPILVESKGLFCSILLLFSMLLFVVVSIVVSRWKMSRKLGILMLIFYVIFLVFSVLLELGTLPCFIIS